MPAVRRQRAWDWGRPDPPYALNRDSAQAMGLVAWWPMAERDPSIVRDWSGNQYGLTRTGAVWKPDHNSVNRLLAIGAPHGMVPHFTAASSQYLEYAGAVVGAEPFTLVSWCYVNDETNNYTPLSIGTSGGTARHQITFNATDKTVRATSVNAAGTVAEASASGVYYSTEFTLSVGVFAANNDRRAYRFGGNKGTNSTSLTVSGMDRTTIGARYASGTRGAYLDGRISDTRIYNRALTDDEVIALNELSTRWQLYYPLGRKSWMFVGKAASVAGSSDVTGPLLWMP